MTFAAYSLYYDLLYQDKDYLGEVDYVKSLLARFSTWPKSILEIGCGTGRHAELLADSGFDVIGVELSKSMLAEATRRASIFSLKGTSGQFDAILGDARTFRSARSFDSVISLFHVVSYQTSNEDVNSMFATVSHHLNPGGLFVFDVWYGPAVLAMRPSVRIKRIKSDSVSVLRIAEPDIDINRNVVEVLYTALVNAKTNGEAETIIERHPMRYFFKPELELLADAHGMRIIHAEEWMTSAAPSDSTWGVAFVAQRI